MKLLLVLSLLLSSFYANEVKTLVWPQGESFLVFLEKNNIPKKLYFDKDNQDKEFLAEIRAGIEYTVMYNEDNEIKQVLIPVSEELQIHITKVKNEYSLKFSPISYQEVEQTIALKIKYSPYQDILDSTNNKLLANEFIRAYQKSVNFRGIQKGDNLVLKYKQKIREGKYFGTPELLAALIEVNKRQFFIFKNVNDGKYYNDKAKSLTSYFFKIPLKYRRISSKFTKKRWHPILKRYRAHLGVDLAAPRGRNIYASAAGRITFRGKKGGYGNVIKIKHKNGYLTLYAHMKGFKSGLKRGSRVSQGTLIGYVGSTGRSTGPHLHFGLYKNGRPLNPFKVVRITKTKLKGKNKRIFMKKTKILAKELLSTVSKKDVNILNLKNIEKHSILSN
ncbi:MAG: peptidoglycan DD-metalloendopeptidase family protein [Campylobacteraceae bacterium]|nr:peptidoglycan DD-metalloendopeptidase family protein [Campylobacteraceae bacterium]